MDPLLACPPAVELRGDLACRRVALSGEGDLDGRLESRSTDCLPRQVHATAARDARLATSGKRDAPDDRDRRTHATIATRDERAIADKRDDRDDRDDRDARDARDECVVSSG